MIVLRMSAPKCESLEGMMSQYSYGLRPSSSRATSYPQAALLSHIRAQHHKGIAMELSREYLRAILIYDLNTGLFRWSYRSPKKSNVGAIAGTKDSDGYLRISIKRKRYKAHKLAFLYVKGFLPESEIDHIDGNPCNNAFKNLRLCTHTQNSRNRHVTLAKSGFKGVVQDGCKWQARITINGKPYILGSFASAELAHAAYVDAAKKHFGEFYNAGVLPK